MKKILLFGAGKSATCLIDYLVAETARRGWGLIVAESNLALARSKTGDAAHVQVVAVQVEETQQREALVRSADLVISLLPPGLHILVARSCVACGRDLLTASYLDESMRALESDINREGLLFLCEMGLDPGIDHMSAMQLIHRIKREGGRIVSFLSHTGGLVSPESDDNPWHYKISWNPRNVVLAGSAGAQFRQDGCLVTRGYDKLFECCETVAVPGIGQLAWYPNRDSLSYLPIYGLEHTTTFIRTTLRYPAYCSGWNCMVKAGLTDAVTPLAVFRSLAEWASPVLPLVNAENRAQLAFLGLFDETPLPAGARVSADVLQHLLETRLVMRPEDKDMIVMLHEIGVKTDTGLRSIRSSLIVHGADHLRTAMAKTVGLPLGIAAIQILEGRIALKGLHIPILPAIYEPVLQALHMQGIQFQEMEN